MTTIIHYAATANAFVLQLLITCVYAVYYVTTDIYYAPLTTTVGGALYPLANAFVLQLLITCVYAIFATHLFRDYGAVGAQ